MSVIFRMGNTQLLNYLSSTILQKIRREIWKVIERQILKSQHIREAEEKKS